MDASNETGGKRFLRHVTSRVRKKLGMLPALSELDPDLMAKELVFRAPTLTPELTETIRRISPQFHLRQDEPSRRFWELNQNGASWGEYEALAPFLDRLGKPSRVLEIGPGLGRSAVFFKKVRGWEDVPFHLYDSAGSGTKYTRAGPRFDDSFCGDLDVLRAVLEHNGIREFEIFDAVRIGSKLASLPGPYDFIYSFYAIGFHWSIEHFLDEILEKLTERGIGAFTLHDRFEDLSVLGGLPHRVVTFRQSWPRGRTCRLLVLGKREEGLGSEL